MLPFLLPVAKNVGWLLLKALVYALVILGLAWCVYVTVIRPTTKPNPTTVQTGGVSYTIKVGFGGCIRLPTPIK
jgi:branched-subunit amino acid ABC-type transport system permease component